jgi:hypothetical protein
MVAGFAVLEWLLIYVMFSQDGRSLHLGWHLGCLMFFCSGASWVFAGMALSKQRTLTASFYSILGFALFVFAVVSAFRWAH